MESSKSSVPDRRKSILWHGLPSFLTSQTPHTPEKMESEPVLPRSETRDSGKLEVKPVSETGRAARQKSKLSRRLSSLLSLTIPSPDRTPSVIRKPLPPSYRESTDDVKPPLYDAQTSQAPAVHEVAHPIKAPPTPPTPPVITPPAQDLHVADLLAHDAAPPPTTTTSTTTNKIQKSPPAHLEQQQQPPLQPEHAPPQVPSVTETQASPPRLRKTRDRIRSNSLEKLPTEPRQEPNRLQPRHTAPFPEPRGRSSSAQPPTNRNSQLPAGIPGGQRIVSNPGEIGRPQSRQSSNGSSPPRGPNREKLRRSWLPGGRSRSNSLQDLGRTGPSAPAWIMSPEGSGEYNTAFLIKGEKVPELWNETGNIYIFLADQSLGHGPSFKVPSFVLNSSRLFNETIQADMAAGAAGRDRGFLSADDAHRQPTAGAEGPGEANVYLSVIDGSGPPNLARLIAIRNLIAFLTGQPLVGTKEHSTIFAAFLQIAALLREFEFSSPDGSSFGEAVDVAFGFYVGQLALADVRHSREKTIEALVLGERMKSQELYTEGFAHAVGKYTAILDIKSPLFDLLSVSTRNRLERAHLDLLGRQANVNNRLESFEFPAVFAGIASSTSHPEYRNVRFKEWRISFGRMRSFVLGYYRNLFGNWPPRARSKKNQFSESGLNRQCLKMLYSDLCALYDLLVDRESLTPRVIDQAPDDIGESSVDPRISVLRKILSEYDQSSPPVLPPIPFDIPKLPSMTAIREDYNELPAKQQLKFDRSIQPHECLLIMLKSRNIDIDQLEIPFLTAYKDFEQKEARGCSPQDMVDQRIGVWLFLYVVLQCLPMLMVDAPGLQFTEGVEYFLCEPPQGNLPWMDDAREVRKVWYEVSGGQNIVELSADVVMFSVEATYHRSHCWQAAKVWEADGVAAKPPPQVMPMSPLEPPPAVFPGSEPGGPNSPRMSAEGSPSSPGSPNLPPHQHHPPRTSSFANNSRPDSPGQQQLLPHHPPRNTSLGPPAVAGSRQSSNSYRSSVVMGLEPLQLPEWGPGEAPRPGSRPISTLVPQQHEPARNGSTPNLTQLARDAGPAPPSGHGPKPSSHGAAGGDHAAKKASTFDDILKGMNTEKGGKKKRFGF